MSNDATPEQVRPSSEKKSIGKSSGTATSAEEKKGWSKEEIISFFKSLVVIVIIVFFVRRTLIEPYKIPSGSMIPTLKISDQILVSKLSYGLRLPFVTRSVLPFASPKRGDVVVFTRPDEPASSEDESSINLIKRVVAVGGEKVEVKGPQVYINDQPLDEPYARWVEGGRPDGDFPAQVVPEGHIFLMGDNRDQSKDSRFWDYPFLDVRRVEGRALFIYWTQDGDFFGRVGKVIK